MEGRKKQRGKETKEERGRRKKQGGMETKEERGRRMKQGVKGDKGVKRKKDEDERKEQ